MLAIDKPEISLRNSWPHLRRWHLPLPLRHDDDGLPVILPLAADNRLYHPFDVVFLLGTDTHLWWRKVTLSDIDLELEVSAHKEAVHALLLKGVDDSLNLRCVYLLARPRHFKFRGSWLRSHHGRLSPSLGRCGLPASGGRCRIAVTGGCGGASPSRVCRDRTRLPNSLRSGRPCAFLRWGLPPYSVGGLAPALQRLV